MDGQVGADKNNEKNGGVEVGGYHQDLVEKIQTILTQQYAMASLEQVILDDIFWSIFKNV